MPAFWLVPTYDVVVNRYRDIIAIVTNRFYVIKALVS